MRISTLRLAEKFIANRKAFFGERYDMLKSAGPNIGVGIGTLLTVGVWVFNFAMPTPDLQHDFRYIFSAEYRQFVKTNGLADPVTEGMWERRVQGYYVQERDAKRSRLLRHTNFEQSGYGESV
ncbi:unnamed protein product [Bursaphelenchus xylophilus]|uniref:(pine wood nematode) hypothetical protein n=1 Tax=Bursaphelenchus xylophilus TaxID=6326 RepID=A0A1I7RV40_BURXY|nr:unnamed protein product [Bursaphelenchus xylophilus]CAG9105136.1 unnamed protein product [Bursaphelenchus xylophilus]